MPLVSIGLPTFRRAANLAQVIRQLQAQTLTDFDVLIGDDHSPDETETVLRSITDPRFRWQRNARNLGVPGNINAIAPRLDGEYIMWLHDHDDLEPTLLEEMVALYRRHPELGFIHPGLHWQSPDGSNRRSMIQDVPELSDGPSTLNDLLRRSEFNSPFPATIMMSRAAWQWAGSYFRDGFGYIADVDLAFRLAARFPIGYAARPLIIVRERDDQHELNAGDVRMLRWSVDLWRDHIERNFPTGHSDRTAALRQWRANRWRRLAIATLSNIRRGRWSRLRDTAALAAHWLGTGSA